MQRHHAVISNFKAAAVKQKPPPKQPSRNNRTVFGIFASLQRFNKRFRLSIRININ
jgi:hypothetical protein